MQSTKDQMLSVYSFPSTSPHISFASPSIVMGHIAWGDILFATVKLKSTNKQKKQQKQHHPAIGEYDRLCSWYMRNSSIQMNNWHSDYKYKIMEKNLNLE